jgi:hypothetical protein
MKIVGEVIHEIMGHGSFVLFFGNEISNVHISILWPYELSHISWSGHFDNYQLIWVYAGGILVSLIFSFLIQILLISDLIKNRMLSSGLLWLALWTFLSSSGYLIIGGINPFGDVKNLIELGVLSSNLSSLLGLSIFIGSFLSISLILRDVLLRNEIIKDDHQYRTALFLFWSVVPITTSTMMLGMGWNTLFLIISFIPVGISLLLPYLFPITETK